MSRTVAMANAGQDIFISHAGADKKQYINPLTDELSRADVTFWIDNREIAWGDSIVGKINNGLRQSRYGLICFSRAFLDRPWPEAEMSSVLNIQNTSGRKRMMPLILNSKEDVLARYPLIAGLAYREFSAGPRALAAELAAIVKRTAVSAAEITVTVEGAHTGKLCRVSVPPLVSVQWLIEMAASGLGGSTQLPVGGFAHFHIRWAIVDARMETIWRTIPRRKKRRIYGLFCSREMTPLPCYDPFDRVSHFALDEQAVFHVYPIEDEDRDLERVARAGGGVV